MPDRIPKSPKPRLPNKPGHLPKVLPLVTDPTPNPDNSSRYRGKVVSNTPSGDGFGKKPGRDA